MSMQLACYGRRYGKLVECPTCPAGSECGHAGDPPAIGIVDVVPGNAEKIPAPAEVDPEDQPADEGVHEQAAALVRRALALFGEAAQWNVTRLAVCIGRASGLSHAEVGARLGISKQACQMHVADVARFNPALGQYLSGTPVRLDDVRAVSLEIVNFERTEAATLTEVSRWISRPN